jgi:hypothetical protein
MGAGTLNLDIFESSLVTSHLHQSGFATINYDVISLIINDVDMPCRLQSGPDAEIDFKVSLSPNGRVVEDTLLSMMEAALPAFISLYGTGIASSHFMANQL